MTIVDFPSYLRIAADAIKMHVPGSLVNRIAVALKCGVKSKTQFLATLGTSSANHSSTFFTAEASMPASLTIVWPLGNNGVCSSYSSSSGLGGFDFLPAFHMPSI